MLWQNLFIVNAMNFANTYPPNRCEGVLAHTTVLNALIRLNSKLKIDFFTALGGVVRSAGIGLPAKGRAPARVAGWAPRISQKPWSVSDFSRLEISIH
jgi:hypothetical protein